MHAQGIAHRDIKPDNLLLTDTDILKVVDFGVSEIFEKESDMATAKSAGSPAYLPPELCVARHGNVSSQAADIWSMGVSLYCLRYGHVPFEQSGVLELYEAIRKDEVKYDGVDVDPNFIDMMNKLLEKNPAARITMDELRVSVVKCDSLSERLTQYRSIHGLREMARTVLCPRRRMSLCLSSRRRRLK